MKAGLSATVFCLYLAASLPAKKQIGRAIIRTKNILTARRFFQLNVLQEGETITLDFDAVYNDGHGCAPQGNGPAKVVDENTLQFAFTDTAGNAGTGTIKRVGDGVIISIKPTRVADSRCIVFYKGDIRLKRAH